MKILIITYTFLPDFGGTEIVAKDYANILAEKGHNVTVISKTYPNATEKFQFRHLQVPNYLGKSFWLLNFGIFLRKLNLDQYDCIILNQCHTPLIAGRFFKKKTLNKTIVLIQGLEVESIYTYTNSFWGRLYCKILRHDFYHRKCLIDCRKIVSVSEFHKNKVISAAKLSEYRNKFQVIYIGIDRKIFTRINSDFKSKHNLNNMELLISVSRIERMKGYDDMLRVFKKLISLRNNYVWIIIGDGPYYPELKEKIVEYSLQNNVFLLGKKNREDLHYYYSAADCFWLLSNYDECLPLVYLEAQSCGLPVIGRNKGGVIETIINEQTGFLVNNDDECLNILVNKKYKEITPENMISFLTKFDKYKAAEKLLK